MLTTVLSYSVDLQRPLQVTTLRTALLTGDHAAHEIRVEISRDGAPVDLAGGLACAYFLRGDGTTVLVDGAVNGSVATAVLPQSCYAVEGRFSLVLQLHLGDTRHSVLWLEGNVSQSRSDLVASDTIPSLDELLNRINALQSATNEAYAAAAQARGLINDQVNSTASTWSSAKLTKELCPDLKAEGELILCRPTPFLTLTATSEGSANLVRTGRNLVNIASGAYDSITYSFPAALPAGPYTLSILGVSAAASARLTYVTGEVLDYALASGAAAVRMYPTKRVASLTLTGPATFTNIQLEPGETAHPYEAYAGAVVAFTGGAAQVAALEGRNVLWADAALTVTGLNSPAGAFAELAERGPIPLATADDPGAIKVGAGLKITSDGTLSATGQGGVADSVAWEDIIDRPDYFNPAPHSHPEISVPTVDEAALLLRMYPVGSIYQSMQPTNPGQLFGGTWQQINDRFLLAAGSYAGAGGTGGASSVALTTTQVPAVTGELLFHSSNNGTVLNVVSGCFSSLLDNTNYFRGGGERDEGNVSVGRVSFNNGGLGYAHENMPPFLAVYTWMRTA